MHLYEVQKGTKGKLLVQKTDADIEIRDGFVTTHCQTFGDEQVVMDFVRFRNSGAKPNSVATRLADKGYYIFCTTNQNDSFLLAIHMSNVKVL